MDLKQLFNDPPIFETKRLIIRKIECSDKEDYYKLASDPVVTAETIWDRHESIQDTMEYLNRLDHRYRNHEAFHWAIIDKTTNRLIGRTGLVSIDQQHEKAEIGYVLSSEYWGQGFVTEATKEAIQYCFSIVKFNRIEGRCNDHNPGSYRVMEKLGMKCEGLLRKQLKIKGNFIDQRIYSILRSEFIANELMS